MQTKLMKFDAHEDGSSYWRVACECSEPHHDAQLYFEAMDEDFEDVSLCLSMEVGFYSRYGWWETAKRRLHAASAILFNGHYTMTGEVMLNRDGMIAMQTALNEGIKHADQCRANWKAKKDEREARAAEKAKKT